VTKSPLKSSSCVVYNLRTIRTAMLLMGHVSIVAVIGTERCLRLHAASR
jgi:hypothetical protein